MPFISDHASMIPRWSARLVSPQRRWLVVICAVVLAALLLGTSNAQRRSGGGFGGRSNSSPSSRYVPSAPLTSGGYIPVPVPVPSYGFGYGGGYGFGGGFGLGGIFIVAVLLGGGFLLFRRFLPVAGQSNQPSGLFTGGNSSGASAVSIQLVLTEGDEVKRALQQVAQTGVTETEEGLASMLSEAALVLLRHPERWTYGVLLQVQGNETQMTNQVGSWASQARAAFTDQTTSRYATTGYAPASAAALPPRTEHQVGERYLAVTLLVAAVNLRLPPSPTANAAQLRAALTAVSGIAPEDLLRTEVVWSPDVEGEFLSEDQAIMNYPALTKI